jgi:hypothetical protein
MSIKKFFKNYIIEQDENLVSISPYEYMELLEDVGGVAERITRLKPYKGKGIVITGPLNLTNFKNVGPLTGVVRIMGRLEISGTNVPHLNGITVDGYVSDYNTPLWQAARQKELDIKLSKLEDVRADDDWNVEHGDDKSERTEALYDHLVQYGEINTYADDEGNDVSEDKYFIYPVGRGSWGYGKRYEWLGGDNQFNPNEYDVYHEGEVDDAARDAVGNMIDDNGINAFSEWVYMDSLDQKEWERWLYDHYEVEIRNEPEHYDIPLELSTKQQQQHIKLQTTIDSLTKQLEQENLTESQIEAIELKIEGLKDIINDIEEDPQGDYDESAIENEINGRVDEWKGDIIDFIKSYGYENDFILDFIDLDELTEKIVSSDGYGGILNSYDGDYDTYDINENTYYVMRVS